jgi:uncharacterized protein
MRHTSFAYLRVVHARRLAALLGALALCLAAAGATTAADSARTTLRLDGVQFRPELASTPEQRTVGLMHRRRAPKDGMLFVFPKAASGGFWMKNTLVPLTIVFFDSRGKRVRRMSMVPCRRDPCTIYDPGRAYRFALELPATDTRPGRQLGPLGRLRQLIAAAS